MLVCGEQVGVAVNGIMEACSLKRVGGSGGLVGGVVGGYLGWKKVRNNEEREP